MSTTLDSCATTTPTGLVHLLNLHALKLPDCASLPALLAERVSIEVTDYLDAFRQQDVEVVDVDMDWISSFVDYLTIFYNPPVVQKYVGAVLEMLPKKG